ncbi:hypothetical protein ACJX0J_008509, partial [Zea mays]
AYEWSFEGTKRFSHYYEKGDTITGIIDVVSDAIDIPKPTDIASDDVFPTILWHMRWIYLWLKWENREEGKGSAFHNMFSVALVAKGKRIRSVNLDEDDNMFQDAAIPDPQHSSHVVRQPQHHVKGGQILGIDYNDIFSPVLEQLDEEIYMDQPEGFMVHG